MMLRITSILTAAILTAIIMPAAARGASSDTREDPSDDGQLELVLKTAEGWSRVTRWLIEYEVRSKAAPMRRVMALSAPGDIYTFTAHFSEAYPWPVDPYAQEFFIRQGTMCIRRPFNRTFSEEGLKRGSAIAGSFSQDVLLPVIPLWPLSDYKVPVAVTLGTDVPIPPAVALRSGAYRLLRDSWPIAGEQCVVFDRSGMDRIWLATNKGVCVMRRDLWDSQFGRPRHRILTEKVDQVASGLWLPTDYRYQYLSMLQDKNGEDIIQLEFTVHILRCMLNDQVADSTFIPTHPPGSLKYEDHKQFTQVRPGGIDLLANIVKFVVRYGHLPTKAISKSHPYAWLLGGLATGLCIGFFYIPRNETHEGKLEARALVPKIESSEPEGSKDASHTMQ